MRKRMKTPGKLRITIAEARFSINALKSSMRWKLRPRLQVMCMRAIMSLLFTPGEDSRPTFQSSASMMTKRRAQMGVSTLAPKLRSRDWTPMFFKSSSDVKQSTVASMRKPLRYAQRGNLSVEVVSLRKFAAKAALANLLSGLGTPDARLKASMALMSTSSPGSNSFQGNPSRSRTTVFAFLSPPSRFTLLFWPHQKGNDASSL
mmetsp:Transcript_41165/g.117435  ORF Transcript_41165/g.117435 Transcript_41165/m.117435 type:complete len:204 (+) Transcript_41165:1364-1975(+)